MKDRNGKDLTEAEEIKMSWQEYTEELYKKVLMIWITTMVWSLTKSQTFWKVKSSGPQEELLLIKLVGTMEFQQNYPPANAGDVGSISRL